MINLAQIAWEKSVIGTVLSDPHTMMEADGLIPADFTGCHQIIWSEILNLHANNSLEVRALINSLRQAQALDELNSFDERPVRGEAYLNEIIESRGTTIGTYVDAVLDGSIRKELRKVGALIVLDAENNGVKAQEALDWAENRIMTMRRTRQTETGVSLGDLLTAYGQRTQGLRDGSLQPAWEPPILALKEKLKFIDDTDYVIFASRPGLGKSSNMRYLFQRSAESDMRCLIFNLENGPLEYAKFSVSIFTGINSDLLKDARLLTPAQMERVKEAIEAMRNLPYYVITLGSPTVRQIDHLIRLNISTRDIQLVGVDYIQLIRNNLENRVNDVGLTSSVLRGAAINYHVPIVAASQMSRGIVHRGVEAEPELSDLRDSGNLEQDATIVVFPWPDWKNPTPAEIGMYPQNHVGGVMNGAILDEPIAVPIRYKIAKNRNGSTGRSNPVLWDKSTNNFMTLTARSLN